jgi:putative methyltransferase (TIGR04325 family)
MTNKRFEKTPPNWEGVFQSWEEAVADGKGFQGERWLQRIVQQLEDYLQESQKFGSQALPARPSSLPMLCSITKPDSIVDFGGSSGWLWHYLKECIPDLLVKEYNIIEIDEICKYFNNSNYHHDQPVSYFSYQDFTGNCDILYTNSTLQYIEDDRILFRLIEKLQPKYLLIEDFLGGEFEDYFSSQIYYENRIPVKFRNRKNFISNIKSLSFELLLSKDYITTTRGIIQPFPMLNIPENKRISYGQTLLFKALN